MIVDHEANNEGSREGVRDPELDKENFRVLSSMFRPLEDDEILDAPPDRLYRFIEDENDDLWDVSISRLHHSYIHDKSLELHIVTVITLKIKKNMLSDTPESAAYFGYPKQHTPYIELNLRLEHLQTPSHSFTDYAVSPVPDHDGSAVYLFLTREDPTIGQRIVAELINQGLDQPENDTNSVPLKLPPELDPFRVLDNFYNGAALK